MTYVNILVYLYREAKEKGILDELLPSKILEPYTDDFIWNIVNQFTCVRDLKIEYPNVYHNICRTKRKNIFLANYTKARSNLKRGIYAYEFEDGYAYVGLTWNFKMRDGVHHRDPSSNVYRHIKKTGKEPAHKVLIDISLNDEEAQRQEDYWIEQYRTQGWKMLNKSNAGSLGYVFKEDMSYEECKKLADGCTTRTEYRDKYRHAFNISKSNGWLEEFFPLRMGRKVQYGMVTEEEMQKHILDRKISTLHDLHEYELAIWKYGKEHEIEWKLWKK